MVESFLFIIIVKNLTLNNMKHKTKTGGLLSESRRGRRKNSRFIVPHEGGDVIIDLVTKTIEVEHNFDRRSLMKRSGVIGRKMDLKYSWGYDFI